MKFVIILASLGAVVLAGCSTIPTAGPTVNDVLSQAATNGQRYFDLIDVDNHVVTTLLSRPAASFHNQFLSYGKPPEPKIGIGDTLSVSIWEAAPGGLFGAAPTTGATGGVTGGSTGVTIPPQVVGTDGGISVPFAGRIRVTGRTPLQAQDEIQQQLSGKAIEPQAIVTVANSVNDLVTVTGDISSAHVPLSVGGTRLLDVVVTAGGSALAAPPIGAAAGAGAAAGVGAAVGGGPKAPIYETFVQLSRNGTTATIPMETLISDPEENIYAWPNDIMTVADVPQTYSVFGATTTNSDVPFSAPKLTLVEALAKAGGLQDMRADPQGVFLFRFEPPSVLGQLNLPSLGTGPDGTSPVVYHLNLKEAKNYFNAKRFPVEDKDVIYVANAPLTELLKVFTLINTVTGPVITGVVVSRSVNGS